MLNKNNFLKAGEISFFSGIFCLPSLQTLSFAFLFFSLITSLIFNKVNFTKDKWNITLLISFSLIVVSSINSLFINPSTINNSSKLIIIATSFRWLLMFISFNYFQFYLKKSIQRILFAKTFVLGAIPIIISCITQYWLGIYGPLNLFNGLFIWFNKPFTTDDQGVAGLFSNQNYTGIWLAVLWPFCIYFLLKERSFNTRRILILFFTILTLYFILMTLSRTAILGVIFSLPLILSMKLLLKLLIFIGLFLIIFYLIILNIPLNLFDQSKILIPNTLKIIFTKITDLNLHNWNNLPRIIIWKNTIQFISLRPLLGYGPGIFPIIYLNLGLLLRADHTHNIIFQIAFDYGIPLSVLLSFFVVLLLFSSYKKVFNCIKNVNYEGINIDKCWFASSFIVLVSQINDITYFDGRIGILIWILLSGLKCIIDDKDYNENVYNH